SRGTRVMVETYETYGSRAQLGQALGDRGAELLADQSGHTGDLGVEPDRVVQPSSAVLGGRQLLAAPVPLQRRTLRDLVLDHGRPVGHRRGLPERRQRADLERARRPDAVALAVAVTDSGDL